MYADMTVARFLEFTGAVRGFRGRELSDRIADVVAKVNLGEVMEQPIETLSKGFKRRVGIAQAIIHDPEVLILDEPTDGLDPNQKHEVRKLITEMASNKAIILSTHILEEVDAVCTRAIIVANGKIVLDGTPNELHARSRWHNAVALLVRADTDPGIADTLQAVAGVSSVEATAQGPRLTEYKIMPRKGRRIIDEVRAAVGANNWPVEQMFVEKGRLDEVFRDITEDSNSR